MALWRAAASGLIDHPMVLGDHLHELRGRLVRVLLLLGALLIVGLIFQNDLKRIAALPLTHAINLVGPEVQQKLGLDPALGVRQLNVKSLTESPISGFTVALVMAFGAAFPYLIYQLWGFVAPALRQKEKVAGFWILPAAVLFFYLGVAFGYFMGLPYFFSWLLSWAAGDPTVSDSVLTQGHYFSLLAMMTVCFGLVMDIPWVVIVLARLRLVPPGWFAKHRKILLMVAVVLAAVVSPPDPYSQMMLLGMMIVLFELGLAIARLSWKAEDPNLLGQAAAGSSTGPGPAPALPSAAPGEIEDDGPDEDDYEQR